MSDRTESARLNRLYERLRERLLDMSLKNPLLSYSHRPQSKQQLRFIDRALQSVYSLLADGENLPIASLREPDNIPADERTPEFIAELDRARLSDVEYLKQAQNLQERGQDNDFELAKAEQDLRDRLRAKLGLAQRQNRRTINPADHAKGLGFDPSFELHLASKKKPEPAKPVLQTLKWPSDLDALLARISAGARSAEQETGLSTLYLVLGFLEWREREDAASRIAPLLLFPVKLERPARQRKAVYELSATSGAAESNFVLQKKLEMDFGRHLPKFEPGDDESGSIEGYFNQVTEAVEGLKGWSVRRFLTLGHFASGRLAMYTDLAHENWSGAPMEVKLARSIVGGTEVSSDPNGSPLTSPEDYPIDEREFASHAPFLIHDADASQHSALIDVMLQKNLVIQGPPGTGKSQTITNVIANILASGKTVLFLSEKQAALDVVKRRLDLAGLGEFCLELHSDKVTPKLAIESLKTRAELGYGGAAEPAQDDPVWENSRRNIKNYLNALHDRNQGDEFPFRSIWKSLRAKTDIGSHFDQFRTIDLPKDVISAKTAFDNAYDELESYAHLVKKFESDYGELAKSTWAFISFLHPGDVVQHNLMSDLERLHENAASVATLLEDVEDLGISNLPELEAILQIGAALPETSPGGALIATTACLDADELEELVVLRVSIIDLNERSAPELENAQLSLSERDLISRLTQGPNGAFGDMTPEASYRELSRLFKLTSDFLEASQAILPALKILDIPPEDFPCAGADAVVWVAGAISHLNEDNRPWFAWRPRGATATFEKACSEWSELVAGEARWRGRFPGHSHTLWPTPDHLRIAAAFVAKGSLGQMFDREGGKNFASIKERLGVPSTASLTVEELETLAAHAQAVSEFLNNRSHQHTLGGAWAGIDTPFDLIKETLVIRQHVETGLGKYPHGPEVFQSLIKLNDSGLRQLATLSADLKTIRRNALDTLRSRNSLPLQRGLSEAKQTRDWAKFLLDLDPERRLARFSLSFRVLWTALQISDAQKDANDRLASHPLSDLADRLAGTKDDAAKTQMALNWVRTVRKHPLPAKIAERLLSNEADALRARIASISGNGLGVITGFKAGLQNVKQAYGIILDSHHSRALADLISHALTRPDELANYLSIYRRKAEFEARGFAPFLNKAVSLKIDACRLPSLLSGVVSRQRAESSQRTNSILSRASSVELEEHRRQFIDRDRRKIEKDRAHIREVLRSYTPPSGSRTGPRKNWTDMELLRNEFSKERGNAPVRELMRRAGTAIQKLKPCFMMSPLSLAKFLPAGRLQFDVLIIDEASQMRPESALGGLLRSDQLVVVGDQKQLPPTDFFSRLGSDGATPADDDENFEDIDDESILEVCLKTFRQARMLRWHYRSRCESLIAFSNSEFYKGSLITFPMARPNSFSVDLVRARGCYEARCNPIEAQTVAEEAIQFMRSFAESSPETIPTLGIVAVNGEQRDLIQEELRRLTADDDLVEIYIEKASQKGEPLFVKNLENVQGDERDFIFISMTYGPKPGENVVLQRFGPINGKQGHRRLNVLFSRARIRVALFTSFGSDDVKPSPTSSEGVRILKGYLAYAESGGTAPGKITGREPDSDFEIEVANRLRGRGYKVDYQVGVSGYRIDLGVRHPDQPERFLAGVECDGAQYHSSKSARDRDRLREEVLTGLGWNIVRVWSTDWFTSADRQTELLVKRLEELRIRPAAPHEGYVLTNVSRPECSDQGPRTAEIRAPSNEPERPPHPDPVSKVGANGKTSPRDPGFTSSELRDALRKFRDTVIAVEMTPWEPQRSILRDRMIELFIKERLDEPEDWLKKVPPYLRSGTDYREWKHYIEAVCHLVGQLIPSPSSNQISES